MANVIPSLPLGHGKGKGKAKGRTAYASGTQAPRPGCASEGRGAGAHQPLSRSCPRGSNTCAKRGRDRGRGRKRKERKRRGVEEKVAEKRGGREGRGEESLGLNEEEKDFCSSPLVKLRRLEKIKFFKLSFFFKL